MYNEFVEDEIISVEELPEEIETMDIEVGGDHLFVANDILTHNSGYDIKENLSLMQMSESIKKVEHSDMVALIRTTTENTESSIITPSEYGQLQITIAKNRSGPKNKTIKLKTKYANFRVDDSYITTSIPFLTSSMDILQGSLEGI